MFINVERFWTIVQRILSIFTKRKHQTSNTFCTCSNLPNPQLRWVSSKTRFLGTAGEPVDPANPRHRAWRTIPVALTPEVRMTVVLNKLPQIKLEDPALLQIRSPSWCNALPEAQIGLLRPPQIGWILARPLGYTILHKKDNTIKISVMFRVSLDLIFSVPDFPVPCRAAKQMDPILEPSGPFWIHSRPSLGLVAKRNQLLWEQFLDFFRF